jgi:two-component system LytT family response regulator
MPERLKILIVDDEPLAREALQRALATIPEIAEVSAAFDERSCADELKRSHPDVVFLDIQMPESDVFRLIKNVAALQNAPPVILVTAHSEHAVKAFEHHATDYVLKPFSSDRIRQALTAAQERIRNRTVSDLLRVLPDLLRDARSLRSPRLAVKSQGRVLFLEANEVVWIQANGNYVMLHCEGGSHLIRGTLAEIESSLDEKQFLRIHRSVIVNAGYVREVRPWPTGEYILKLRNGKELTVTRKYKQNLGRIASLGLGLDPFNSE